MYFRAAVRVSCYLRSDIEAVTTSFPRRQPSMLQRGDIKSRITRRLNASRRGCVVLSLLALPTCRASSENIPQIEGTYDVEGALITVCRTLRDNPKSPCPHPPREELLLDPWGEKVRSFCGDEFFVLVACGPDRKCLTGDDVVVWCQRSSRRHFGRALTSTFRRSRDGLSLFTVNSGAPVGFEHTKLARVARRPP